jgi:hypothetical protein
MSDPYAYGFDEKSEVRDKLLTDWARIRLMKMAEMSIFWIGHITDILGLENPDVHPSVCLSASYK